jgi:small conductance mechanosensitive channel
MPDFDFTFTQTLLANRILPVLIGFALALLVIRFSRRIAGRFLSLTQLIPEDHRLREKRQQTLRGIFAGSISLLALGTALFFCTAQFVDISTLVWVLGLFSAAFGLGFRPLISDVLTGVFFAFEDTLNIGDKVEIVGTVSVEGVVEAVDLRTLQLRGNAGELLVIPNGEIRIIRNYSRGLFSLANITLKLPSKDLHRALDTLEAMQDEAVEKLPNLIEPWQIISEEGEMGQHVHITLVAKAVHGKAAVMRPRLLTLVQERLQAAGIELSE